VSDAIRMRGYLMPIWLFSLSIEMKQRIAAYLEKDPRSIVFESSYTYGENSSVVEIHITIKRYWVMHEHKVLLYNLHDNSISENE
jgi:hypothetical protein